MINNLIDRYIGRFAKARLTGVTEITSLTTSAYAIGDVLNAGGLTLPIAGVSLSKDTAIDLVQVMVWEKFTVGSSIKPGMTLHFFDTDYTPPAQNAAFLGPTGYLTHIGSVTVASSDFVEYNGYALAQKAVALRLRPVETSRSLYMVAVTTGTPTFGTGASLTFQLDFDA